MSRSRHRVLVTGAGGFLAGHLVGLLRRERRGLPLTLLSRRPAPGIVACDLANAEAARRAVQRLKPSLVFHLAGTSRQLSWEEGWRAHVLCTVNLYEALRETGRKVRVVLAGSAAEYGNAGGERPVREESLLEPLTAYGASKLSQALAAFSYGPAGIETVEARLFNILGPGTPEHLAPGAFAAQIAAAEAGRQAPRLEVGDLTPRRDYLDVRDSAAALELLARRGRPGQAYNVCAGRPLAMKELLARLLRLSPRRLAVVQDPARRRTGQVASIHGSAAKLRRATGWRPRVSLEASLRDTLEGYRGS